MNRKLTPSDCHIKVISSDFKGKTKLKEKWYGTEYSEKREEKLMKELSSLKLSDFPFFALPPKNILIPTDFTLVRSFSVIKDKKRKDELLNAPPVLITPAQKKTEEENENTKKWKVWYKLDESFQQPKIYTIISLAVPSSSYNAAFLLKSKLFNSCFMDSISEFIYDASLAGLSFDIEFTSKGVQFTLTGFSDKFELFANEVVNLLINFQPRESSFFRFKDVLEREFRSWKTQQPYQHVSYYTSLATETLQFPIEELSETLKTIQISDITSFLKDSVQQSFGTALIMGNCDVKKAQRIIDIFDSSFSFSYLDESLRSHRDVKLIPLIASSPSSSSSSLPKLGYLIDNLEPNENDDNSAVSFYFQLPTRDISSTSVLEVLADALENSFYDSLRTKQQLGYIVFSGLRFREGIYTLVFTVQSNLLPANEITDRILTYLDSAVKDIESMDDKTFASYKEGIITRKLEPDQRLTQQAGRFWSEIVLGDKLQTPNFYRHQQEAGIIKKLSLKDFKAFALNILKEDGAARHLLVSQVTSKKTKSKKEGGAVADGKIEQRFDVVPDVLTFMSSQPPV